MRNIFPDILTCLQVLLLHIYGTRSLQCYSCKASGVNEIDANIGCLGQAYLENCDEFYHYYDDVEDQEALSYEYYEYVGEDEAYDETQSKGRAKQSRDGKGRSRGRSRAKRQANDRREAPRSRGGDDDKYSLVDQQDQETGGVEDDYEYEYDYNYDLNFTNILTTTKGPPTSSIRRGKGTSKGESRDRYEEEEELEEEGEEEYDDDELEPVLPKDPEHYCYSTTKRGEWESYTVEKGCKKIMYCKSLRENNPDWTNPWNFCCDKSRCNAKLVIDQPQRIFGMKCRRTDDCIQGHTNRHVCPHYFKSCPKISSMHLKMECRDKMVSRGGKFARYQFQSRDKKCYCSPGYKPRGPICANSSVNRAATIVCLLSGFIYLVF